jgi:hypothetical protein
MIGTAADSVVPVIFEARQMIQRTEAEITPVGIDDERFARDWNFAYEQLAAGQFQEMKGKFVGVFEKHVVAVGDSESNVRELFEASSRGNSDQLVVLWVDSHDLR